MHTHNALRALLLAAPSVLFAACTMATPHERGIDDWPYEEDEPPPAEEPTYELCTLPDTEGLLPEAYVIQIRNPECSTAVCLHHRLETFCTHQCTRDSDCQDIGRGYCSFYLTFGDPEIVGSYCVPDALY